MSLSINWRVYSSENALTKVVAAAKRDLGRNYELCSFPAIYSLTFKGRSVQINGSIVKCGFDICDVILCRNQLIIYQNGFKRLECYDLKTFDRLFYIEFPEAIEKDGVLLSYIYEYRKLVTYVKRNNVICLMGVHKLGQVFPEACKQLEGIEFPKIFVLDGYVILSGDSNDHPTRAFDPLENLKEMKIEGRMFGYFEARGDKMCQNILKYNHPKTFEEEWFHDIKAHNVKEAFEYGLDKIDLLLEFDNLQLKECVVPDKIPLIEYIAVQKSEKFHKDVLYNEIARVQMEDTNWFESLRMIKDGLVTPMHLNDPKNTALRHAGNW